jgi:RimJ/RimL family protein N-acetyltransferase
MQIEPIQKEGRLVCLKPLLPKNVGDNYIRWLNDTTVTRFTEISSGHHTFETATQYVKQTIASTNAAIWRIVTVDRKHIGNIRLSQLNVTHRRAQIALLIGEQQSHSKGFGSTAIEMLTLYAFERFKLHKLSSGIYETNRACIKAFEKAGFHKEARRQEHAWDNDIFVDVVEMARFNSPIKSP